MICTGKSNTEHGVICNFLIIFVGKILGPGVFYAVFIAAVS